MHQTPWSQAHLPHGAMLSADEAVASRQFVTSLARGLAILEAFRDGDGKFGNQAIATRTGLPKPTVSRLTHTLVELGYLAYCRRERKYSLASSTLALGFAVQHYNRARHRLRPHLEALVGRFGGSAVLVAASRQSVICVDRCGANGQTAPCGIDTGTRIALFDSTLGRLFAAALPARKRSDALAHLRHDQPADGQEIAAQIEQIVRNGRKQGFYTSELGAWGVGLRGVLASLGAADETASGVLACFVPTRLMTRDKPLLAIGSACARAAQEIAVEVLKTTVSRNDACDRGRPVRIV